MNDEPQFRELLARAAELPDRVQPPVARLVERGRHRRAGRAIASVAAAGAVAAAAFAVPPLVARSPGLPSAAGGPYRNVVPPAPPRWPATSGPSASRLARFRWSSLPPSPLGPISNPVLAWTGSELIELGGLKHKATSFHGAVYDPASRRWHRMPDVPATVLGAIGPGPAITVWDGSALLVAAGNTAARCQRAGAPRESACLPTVSLYDPAANSWSATRVPGRFYGLIPQAAVWTGRAVVLAAVNPAGGKLAIGAYYPATGRWQLITPTLPADRPPGYVTLATAPGRLYLWSLWEVVHNHSHGFSINSGVSVLALTPAGTWHLLTAHWPQHQTISPPILTGYGFLFSPGQIWCGNECSPPSASFPGFFANAQTLARHPIPKGPLGQTGPSYAWTGGAIIAVDLYAEITGPGTRHIRPADMAAWDSASGWLALPSPPGHPSLAAPPVWTGSALLELTANGQLLSFAR